MCLDFAKQDNRFFLLSQPWMRGGSPSLSHGILFNAVRGMSSYILGVSAVKHEKISSNR